MENKDINLEKSFSAEEINAVLVCMSYYSLRNRNKMIGGVNIDYGCELFSKLLGLLRSAHTQLEKASSRQDNAIKIAQNIKPCPFCGSEGATTFNSKFGFQVFCTSDECFMNEVIMINMDTEDKAIKVWNERRDKNE